MIKQFTKLFLLGIGFGVLSSMVHATDHHPNYLRIPMLDDFETLDPGLIRARYDGDIAGLLFVALTKYEPQTFKVLPRLASSWSVSSDGTVYTFKLRKDVKWTNGDTVNAHDLVYALRRNLNPKTASPYVFIAFIVKNAIKYNKGEVDAEALGIRAVDDFTVEYTLEQPAGYFPAMVTMPTYTPLPRKAIEQHGTRWFEPQNMVSNGPYKLDTWARGNILILKKNPNYYAAASVKVEEVRYLVIRESSTGLAMYENDELDILGGGNLPLPSPELDRIKSDPVLSQQFSTQPDLCTYYYDFNNKRPPMDNVLVRKAIAAAIDRQWIIDKVTKGGQTPAHTFTRPPIFGSVDPSEGIGIRYNPTQAKKWLAEAGYPNGKGFPEIELMHNTSESHARIAQAVQAMLKRTLNINVRITNQEWKVFLKTRNTLDAAHMSRDGWCADYPDANNWLMEVLHPTKSDNTPHWENAEYSEIVDRAQVISDPEERKRLYRRAEQILNEEVVPITPIYFYTTQALVKPWLKNWYFMPMGYQEVENWELAP